MWSVPTRGTASVADDSSTSTANSFLKVLFFGVLVDLLFGGCGGVGVFVLVCLRRELVNKRAQFLRIVVSSWFVWYIIQERSIFSCYFD